jgi:hypothetical protein
MDINNTTTVGVPPGESDPWPSTVTVAPGINFQFGMYRTLGSSIKWSNLVTSCNPLTYTWTNLDTWLGLAQQNGQQVMFTAYWTPNATNNGSTCSATANTGNFLPSDINADGTGTDAIWPGFINDLLTHLGNTNGPLGIRLIKQLAYLEVWNEPNVSSECNGTDHGGGTGNCTAKALARLTADAWTKVQSANSTYGATTKVISPAVTANNPQTDCTQSGNQSTINSFLNSYLSVSPVQGYSNPLSSYVDTVGFHGYVDIASNISGSGGDDPASGAKCISDLISSVQNVVHSASSGAFAAKPIHDTEGSWGTDQAVILNNEYITGVDSSGTTGLDGGGAGREQAFAGIYNLIQASYTAQTTTNCTGVCPTMAGLSWYGWDFQQPSKNGEPSTGQYWDEFHSVLAPAGTAYGYLYHWLSGASLSTGFGAPYQPCGPVAVGSTIWTCQFSFPNGKFGLAVWDQSGNCLGSSCSTTVNSPWTVPKTPGGTAYTTYQTMGGTSTSITGGTVPITLQPILINN